MKNRNIPKSWTATQLGELIDGFESGRNLKALGRPASAGEFGVLKISAVTWGTFEPSENKALTGIDTPRPREVVRGGDLLISRANTSDLVGAVVLVDRDYSRLMLPDKILRLRVRNELADSRYLLFALRHAAVRKHFSASASGTSDSMRNLSQPKIEAAPIPLAPIKEQRRIVARIEALTARSRRAKEALDAIPPLLEKFRQSVLASAFRGDLTREWRSQARPLCSPADALRGVHAATAAGLEFITETTLGTSATPVQLPVVPETWVWTEARSVVDPAADIVYGIVQPGPEVPNGIPYVRGMDIEDGRILEAQLKRTSQEIADKYSRAALKGGDVLLGIIRATKVALVPSSLDGANITQGTARLRPSTAILSEYLAGWLETSFAQDWLHSMYRGIDMPGLNLRDVRRLPVPVAPIEEQQEIVRVLRTVRLRTALATAAVAEARDRESRLNASILSRAFAGTLVPQDPADEPASALLERIRAERAAASADTPRSSRTRVKQPVPQQSAQSAKRQNSSTRGDTR